MGFLLDSSRFVEAGALIDHLLLYWDSEESSGNILDSHAGEDLTVINAPGSAAGIIGNARTFAAASSMTAHRASDTVLSRGNTSFTWSIWCQLASKPGKMALLQKGGLGYQLMEYYLIYNSDVDRFEWTVADGTHTTDDTTMIDSVFGSPPLNTWIHICAIFDAATKNRKLKINGGTTQTTSGPLWPGHNNSDDMYLGSLANIVFFWDGRIDEVALFDKALSDGECLTLWNGGAGLQPPF